MRKSTILSIAICLFCITVFSVRGESGDKRGRYPGGYFAYGMAHQYASYRGYFASYPNRFGRGYLRQYYFAYPYQEKSPYEDLVIRPAGELQITVRPAHAQVFVDGYEVEKENNSYSIGLLTGVHSVEVIAEGYEPYREEVQIEKGKKKVLLIALTQ